MEEEKNKNPQKINELNELITYLLNNYDGINTVDGLKEAGLAVDTMGAIEARDELEPLGSTEFSQGGQLIINDK